MEELTLESLQEEVLELREQVRSIYKILETSKLAPKGPDSTRKMNIEDAERVVLGDLKTISHKDAAALLGLSYGQVYSARGGYTFSEVFEKTLKKDK